MRHPALLLHTFFWGGGHLFTYCSCACKFSMICRFYADFAHDVIVGHCLVLHSSAIYRIISLAFDLEFVVQSYKLRVTSSE